MELEALTPGVWDQLASRLPRAGTMAPTEQLSCGKSAKPFVCICASRDKTFHLMLELPPRTSGRLETSKTAGLSVGRLNDHFVRSHGRKNLIDVKCSAAPHLPAFTAIAKEIGGLVLRDKADPVSAVNQTIRKWKSFWGKPSLGLLSEDRQLGLLGELAALNRFIETAGPARSVDGWKGPLGFRHDFLIGNTGLEVKASLSPKRCHLINGLDQLAPVAGAELFLLSWTAARVIEGGVSLVDLVARAEASLRTCPAEFEVFQERLSAAGFSPSHAALYEETRFVLGDGRVYAVNADFPKLIADSLKRPISPRITGLVYSVNLDGLPSRDLRAWSARIARDKR